MNYDYVELGTSVSQYDEDLSGHSSVEARYIKSHQEYDQGNPFIEALPPMLDQRQLVAACTRNLTYYDGRKAMQMSTTDKMLSLLDLRNLRFFLPFQESLEIEFRKALVASYRHRQIIKNPDLKLPVRMQNADTFVSSKTIGHVDDAANPGFALIGYSGCGKSSALKMLTDRYPQVIYHNLEGMPRITQIVYLPVVCLPHSNFDALYISIGKAVDDALGNLVSYYEEQLRRTRGLGNKLNKVCELIETFSIGVIIFDEIQLINFDSTLENSYDSLLTIHNRTKVGIGAIGTEDAYQKMFPNLRTSRRLGMSITASTYCGNMQYFATITKHLFRYQWFDTKVTLTQDMITLLHERTRGIVDQLISLYSYIHYDYLIRERKPAVNGEYIDKVFKKYFGNIAPLLSGIDDPANEQRLSNMSIKAKDELQQLIDQQRQVSAASAAIEAMDSPEFEELNHLRAAVIRNISKVSDDYNESTITNAFNLIYNANVDTPLDEIAMTKLVMKKLTAGTTDRRRSPKKHLDKEQMHKEMRSYILDES